MLVVYGFVRLARVAFGAEFCERPSAFRRNHEQVSARPKPMAEHKAAPTGPKTHLIVSKESSSKRLAD